MLVGVKDVPVGHNGVRQRRHGSATNTGAKDQGLGAEGNLFYSPKDVFRCHRTKKVKGCDLGFLDKKSSR